MIKAEYHEIRRRIARHIAAQGLTGSAEHEARYKDEVRAVSAPLHSDLRRVLVERLRALPTDGGVDTAVGFTPVSAEEAARFGVPDGTALPAYLEPKLARSYDAPLQELVDRGVIASAEVLARVLPQVTAHVRAESLDDSTARRLYAALYGAFRRRRGLVLLNYQHQVRFHELPWVAAMEAVGKTNDETRARARAAVASTSSVALRAFPYTIIPNKLVTELNSLTNAAALQLPLVEELAADIFMGSFTPKFVEAAKTSARLLRGTLYQRYYAIDVDEVLRIPTPKGTPSAEFAALCARRAAPLDGTSRSSVARNGKVIEQAQTYGWAPLCALARQHGDTSVHMTGIDLREPKLITLQVDADDDAYGALYEDELLAPNVIRWWSPSERWAIHGSRNVEIAVAGQVDDVRWPRFNECDVRSIDAAMRFARQARVSDDVRAQMMATYDTLSWDSALENASAVPQLVDACRAVLADQIDPVVAIRRLVGLIDVAPKPIRRISATERLHAAWGRTGYLVLGADRAPFGPLLLAQNDSNHERHSTEEKPMLRCSAEEILSSIERSV